MLDSLKQYKKLTVTELYLCLATVNLISCDVAMNIDVLYPRKLLKQHIARNIRLLKALIAKDSPQDTPGFLLFWIFKQCRFYELEAPDFLPHIIRKRIDGVEFFYCATYRQWKTYIAQKQGHNDDKNAPVRVIKPSKKITATDHAKLRFLERVGGVDILAQMRQFPHAELNKRIDPKGEHLQSVVINKCTYIVKLTPMGHLCTTVLAQGMEEVS